ncbi:hypothetical protein CLV77_0068 [Brevirhabdus pacifica]|nr:DciA family protein [Brevirhabdus pacifica]PJJ85549.1 hypothetical protein CLV77_0068 [Brevirhabdus pacifica]
MMSKSRGKTPDAPGNGGPRDNRASRTFGRGFRQAAGFVQPQIRTAGESRGFAVTRLLTHWVEIVGEEMAAMARPVEVGYSRSGGLGATLTVLTTGAMAPMLEMQKETLREKVNACYGYSAISRIRITQTAPIGFAEGQVSFDHAPKAGQDTTPDPEIAQEAHRTVRPITDQGLRQALEALGRNVLSKRKTT